MTEPEPKSRRCPYCGCGFEPQRPDQVYCSPFCEEEHRATGAGNAKGDSAADRN